MIAVHTHTKRRVNERMWDRLHGRCDDEPIAFFCECDDESCYLAVWLTADAFEHATRDPGWVALVPRHAAAA
ncbi:MAG: hypothetical protein ABUS54_06695 [Actinomycetota bacterium]